MQTFYSSACGSDVVCATPKTNGVNLIFSSPEKSGFIKNHFKAIALFLLAFFMNSHYVISQTCTCPGTNLVQNPSWENGTNNWNWSGGNLSYGPYTAQCETNAGHFQITNTSNNWVSQHIGTVGSNGISVGSILTLQVYAGTYNPSYYHRVGISYFTSNWTYISGNYTEVNSQLPTMAEYTVVGTVPANAYYINVEKGGNGDWINTDRWCVSVSQCNPDNSSAPPFCAPQPTCPQGNNFLWSQNINSSDGTPSETRLTCSSQLTYIIPGSYPSAFNGPVNVTVSDVVSYDGYSGRNSVTQQNEKWRILFKKNGGIVYATPYTNDVEDLKTQAYWKGSLGTTTYLPNGADQIIIEHWAVANNNNCSNGPNAVTPVSVCIGYTPVTCSNVTNGGQIGSNQTSCLATFDPVSFTNISSPSGGTGTLEYLWMRSTTTCVAPNGINNGEWEEIPNSNSAMYNPGPIHQNTCYIRYSRRTGCTNYDGESNVVSVTVSGPAVQIGSALNLVKDRVISNEIHCGNSNQRVLWLDCLLDNSPGGSAGNSKYWRIISGGAFREYCDGTAYYEMRVQNLVTPSYELDIKVVLSGRTFSPPPGSPHIEGCTSSASSDWYYYTNMTGTISGVNGLAGALLNIDRDGASFQVGTNASLFASPGQYGASAKFIYNVINHPSTFKLGTECNAEFNFLLSGGALSYLQSINCEAICRGQSTTLQANGAGGKPGYTYSWDNNLGNGQTKTVSPTTTTIYKVTITDTNGCTSTSQTSINIHPQPVLNAGQDVEICVGQSVLLTVNATNGTSPYTYTWPNPPGGTGSSKSVSPTTTTTYVVTVTDAKGCTATDDVRITVNQKPSISLSAAPACAGSTLTVTSTPSGGIPGYSYNWSGPNGYSVNTQNISRPNATVSMAGNYAVTVTDSKGCQNTSNTNVTVAECEGEICFIGVNNDVSAKTTYQIIYNVDPALHKVRIRTTFSKNFVDNTYGNNVIGWPGGHSFGNLTGSDHLQMALYDANNVKKLELKMDYLTSFSGAPSGYKSLGVTGGDGSMIFGNVSDVLNVVTSLDRNFNTYGYVLTTNSPETNDDYVADPNYPNWIYDVWYETEVKLSAFGSAGFGTAGITGLHASPSKTGNNTEIVIPGDCCLLFEPEITGANFKCSDSQESIQLSVTLGQSFLWNNGATTQSITINPTQPTTYSVTVTDDDDCTKVLSQSVNVIDCDGIICFVGENEVSADVKWTIFYSVNENENKVRIRSTFSKNFVDNTYGTNAIGWSGGHTFGNLTGSDHLIISLFDANNVKKLEMKMDYITASTDAPSGYRSLGVSGGDGSMIFGNASDVLGVITSLDKNFNDYGYVLTTNSPATDANYSVNPAYPNWIYEVWYEAEVKLSAFGSAGFGTVDISGLHASPSKTGNNTEEVVPGPCCEFEAYITGDNEICAGQQATLTANVIGNSTLQLPATNDSYLDENNPTKNYGNCKEMFIGTKSGHKRRGLIKFDVSSIPANATITSAQMFLTKKGGTNTSTSLGVYNVTSIWSENAGGCAGNTLAPNWTQRASNSNWGSAGGDYTSLISSTNVAGNGLYQWNVLSAVQSWSANPNNNKGMLIRTINEGVNDEFKFATSEEGNADEIPYLNIVYQLPQGGIDYIWSNGATTQTISVSPTQTTSYTVSISAPNVCEAGGAELTVTVSNAPSVTISGNSEICIGEFTTLNAVSPSAIGYLWNTGATTASISVNPAVNTIYYVTVTDINGCTGSNSRLVTTNPGFNINLETAEVCVGSTLSITTTVSGGSPGFNYIWSGPNGFNTNTQNVIINNAILSMAGTYSVTVTDTRGCTGTANVQVVVNPNPSIMTNAQEVCAGNTLLINSFPNGGTPGYSYNWSGPGGYTANTQNVSRVNATPAMSGVYTVTLTDSKGCIAVTNVSTSVNPNPTITAGSNTPVCSGNDILLTSTPNGGTPGYTFNWSGPNGYSSIIQNPVIANANNTITGTYNVTVTDNNGCVANSSTSVTVVHKPISGIDGPQTTCAKESVLFIATPPAGAGATYNWTFQGGNPANGFGPSASSQWDLPGEYLITLVVTKDGCDSTYTRTINITQEVFSIAGPDKEICQGGNVTINGQGPAGADFSWTVVSGDGTSIDNGGGSMNVLVSPLYTTVYRLTVSQNGCVRTDEVTVMVNVSYNPIADAGDPLEICAGVITTIGGNPTGTPPPAAPNTPLGYIWSPASGLNATSIPNPTLTLTVPGAYTYQVIVIALSTGCTDTATVTHTIQPKAKVGDFVWEDFDGNGRQDLGEQGLNEIQVTLHNANTNAIVASTTTTNRNGEPGYYEFEVCSGTYYIIFGNAPGYTRTYKNALNTNNTNDSDANANTGRTDNFILNPGDNNMTIDAGYWIDPSLGDFVWEDLNVNGIQDIGEPGISGVIVRLLDANGVQIDFTVTDANGYYIFDFLSPGYYRVKFDTKPGYIPTAKDRGVNDAIDSDADPITGQSHLVTLLSAQHDPTIDAGFYRLARIGDFVWEDTNLNNMQDPFEPVLQNVTVTLNGIKGTDGSAVNLVTSTDVMGRYDFNNLTPGTYTVTFTRPSSIYLSVTPNVGPDDKDSDAHPVTGQTGAYILLSGEYNNTIDAGYYRCAKVGDLVWIDLGPNPNIQDGGDVGINNVEVRLYQAFTNLLIETQLTRNSPIDGSAGYYLFECVPPGTYYVKVIKPNPTGTVVRYDFVQPNQGGNDMLDSDVVDFLNGTTLNFTVNYAQIILDIDIGLISVLPVNVKDLTGWWNKEKDVNELFWVTSQEVNNSHFVIERSVDNGRFIEVGKIEGQGTSTAEFKYVFTDHNIAENGEYVYRITQVDYDGTVNGVGDVFIKVYRDDAYSIRVYPNPTNGLTFIDVIAKAGLDASYEIYDATGKVVYRSLISEVNNSGYQQFIYDMSSFLQGVYYTKIQIGDQQIIQRIVKVE